MKTKTYFLIAICGFLFISCASKKLPISNFVPLSKPVPFNGTYLNENDKLADLFNLERDKTDFITIEYDFNNIDTLKLSYLTENGLEQRYYKGVFKNNFFEIYFRNTRVFIPLFYTVSYVDRLRVGLDNKSNLLLYKWNESQGWVLIIFAGGMAADEYSYSIPKFDPSKYGFPIPHIENEKWGFIDSAQNIVAELKYDLVRLFDGEITRVKLNGKWGLINTRGKELTEIKYDKIFSADNGLLRVILNGKIGYLDINGQEIIPPEYDEIDYLGRYKSDSKARKGDKYGYVTTKGVLCPAVFDKAKDFSIMICPFHSNTERLYGKVKYKGESYLVDSDGYMYKYKCSIDKLTLFKESKIKGNYSGACLKYFM